MTETTQELRAYHDAHENAFYVTRWERTPPMGAWEEVKAPPVVFRAMREDTALVYAHAALVGCSVTFTN